METNTNKAGEEMTTEQAQAFVQSLNPQDIRVVYSGRQGCMCGCKGKYNVNLIHLAEAEKDRGYAYGDDERNQHMVTKVLRLLQADERTQVQDGCILYVPRAKTESESERSYVAFVCNSKRI